MDMMQLALLLVGAMAAFGIAGYAFVGPSPSKASAIRKARMRRSSRS